MDKKLVTTETGIYYKRKAGGRGCGLKTHLLDTMLTTWVMELSAYETSSFEYIEREVSGNL